MASSKLMIVMWPSNDQVNACCSETDELYFINKSKFFAVAYVNLTLFHCLDLLTMSVPLRGKRKGWKDKVPMDQTFFLLSCCQIPVVVNSNHPFINYPPTLRSNPLDHEKNFQLVS